MTSTDTRAARLAYASDSFLRSIIATNHDGYGPLARAELDRRSGDTSARVIPMGDTIPATRIVRAGDVGPGDTLVHGPDRFDGGTRLRRVLDVTHNGGYVQLWTSTDGSWYSALPDYRLTILAES